MSDGATKPGDRDTESTEDLWRGSTPAQESFEHRRVVATARRRLFGRGREVYIDRYRIERRLGFGGMGEVYLAHDDGLSRKVAIKRVLDAQHSEIGQARLRREAQALARLSHPNVVQIYEIGEHERCTYLAMEYVDGETLGAWLAAEPREWQAVLGRFVSAGRGLSAAHDAGLVHRDFKPDNVLLSAHGRVLVADFGLALGDEPPQASAERPRDRVDLRVDVRMSVAGAVRGTIRYMPLEQLRGEGVDARSDQFSFCVALYEALWGEPPFSLANVPERLAALERGVVVTPSPRAGTRAPARYWRVIRRGLSKDPDQRWPSMHALLGALDDLARRRRRQAWVASVSAALLIGGGAMIFSRPFSRPDQVDPCAQIERELEGTWDDERRASLERQLDAIDASHAQASRERVFAGLDLWSQDWARERERVCRATAERRIEPAFAGLQTACHTRQRRRVEDLVGLLLEPGIDDDRLANAVEAITALPLATACEDEFALLGIEPASPTIAARVEALRRDLGRAHELRLLGSVEAGLDLARATHRSALELEYGPLTAETLAELAKAELSAGSLDQALERVLEAVDAAEFSRHDYLVLELWTEFTLRSLVEMRDEAAGARGLRRAEAANGRVKASPRALARLAFARALLAQLRGDLEAAERGYRDAIATSEPGDLRDQPSYLSNLANLVAKRDVDEAIELMRQAVALAEASYGPHHPQTARLLYDLGLALRGFDAANPEIPKLLERAASIWRSSHSRPHRDLATAEWLLSVLAVERGELDVAEAHARALASIQFASLPPDHRHHGRPAQLLATIHSIRGEYQLALEQLDAALAIWAPLDGEDDDVVMSLRSDAASNLLALGRLDEAGQQLDALIVRVQGHPSRSIPVYLARCEVALRRGDLETARAELRALDAEVAESGDLGIYGFNYALMRALVDLRHGELGPAAVELLGRGRVETVITPDQLAAWLDQLGVSPAELETLELD